MSPSIQTPLQVRSIGTTPGDWSQTLEFGQFNPSLGTLQGIDVGLTPDVTGSVSIENLDDASASVTAELDSYVSAFTPTNVFLMNTVAQAVGSGTLASSGANTVLALSGSGTADVSLPQTSIDGTDFIGTGTVPLALSNSTQLAVTGSANMEVSSHADTGASISLQYTYTPPPSGGDWYGDDGSVLTMAFWNSLQGGFVADDSVTTAPQSFTFADSTADWSDSLPVAQFNPALGTLEAVNLTLSGDIQGSVSSRNEDTDPAAISTSQTVTISLGSSLSVAPTVNDSMWRAGGASESDTGLAASEWNNTTLTDASDLAAFIGQGTVAVPMTAVGSGSLYGPGDLLATPLAQSDATATVSYTYLPTGGSTDADALWNAAGGQWTNGSDWGSGNAPQPTNDAATTPMGFGDNTVPVGALVASTNGMSFCGGDNALAGACDAPLGNNQLEAGWLHDLIAFTNGAGGSDTIQDFLPGQDHIGLSGYGLGIVGAVLQSAVATPGGTTLTLPDGTSITVAGADHLRAADFITG